MPHDPDLADMVPKAARNEVFYFIARAASLFLTLIVVPAAGFTMARVISQQDTIISRQQEQNIELRVLGATVKDKLDVVLSRQNDQEIRLRQLEQRK